MSQIGYLYVLANSSMPGLVKVGMTTRTPSERADELAKVTGVPTPFIVVFEQLFQDCATAEKFVHTLLESRGFRVAQNREFFNAPVTDVVRAIIAAPGAVEHPHKSVAVEDANAYEDFAPPWKAVTQHAEDLYYGLNNVLQDHAEALRVFKQAAKLGNYTAYAKIGQMYQFGQGTAMNRDEAVAYYKEGARNDHQLCYWQLALLFEEMGHNANSEKCAKAFIENPHTAQSEEMDIALYALSRIGDWTQNGIPRVSETLRTMLATKRYVLRVHARSWRKSAEQHGNELLIKRVQRMVDYTNDLCSTA